MFKLFLLLYISLHFCYIANTWDYDQYFEYNGIKFTFTVKHKSGRTYSCELNSSEPVNPITVTIYWYLNKPDINKPFHFRTLVGTQLPWDALWNIPVQYFDNFISICCTAVFGVDYEFKSVKSNTLKLYLDDDSEANNSTEMNSLASMNKESLVIYPLSINTTSRVIHHTSEKPATVIFYASKSSSIAKTTFNTDLGPTEQPSPKNSTPFIAATVVLLIIILLLVIFLVYHVKLRRKSSDVADQGPIYAVPEVHYAQLVLPKSRNLFTVERVKYSEVVGVLKPRNQILT
ncbi:hypothetical protein O0L34_g11574 [Tuta absoluta]|nr:hypothetical protein O0L34_g11574 [Tuta absoluta]